MELKKIILPKELYEKLDLGANSKEVEVVEVDRNRLIVRTASSKVQRDYAPRWFLLPTAISAIIFLSVALLRQMRLVPLTSAYSIGTAVDVIANGTALITFILAYIARRKSLYHMMPRKVYWRTFATVVVSELIISTLALIALFWFLDQIFHGAQFDIFTSTFIFAAFAGILNYFVIFIVDSFSIEIMVNMLIMVAVGGLVASMATNGNPYWWKRNFSLLGTSQSQASFQFNLTLIVSGALFLALIDYIFVALTQKYGRNWRHIVLRVLLTLTALCIAGVGLVPNNGTLAHFWHDQIALFIVYFMGLTVLAIRWLLPEGGRNLINISYGIVIFLFVSYVLWRGFHYFSLTAFEILSFAASFAWLMLFINRLTSMLWDEHKIYQVTFVESDDEDKDIKDAL